MQANTDLVIIGAGAAGLMAACTAAELGLRAVLVERKHQPGRKLLMCGNNRCNLTNNLGPAEMTAAYGEPVAAFLGPAITAFPPAALRQWFASAGLPTMVQPDNRVFPRSGKADDVLHCFTDFLREHGLPLLLNCPVTNLRREPGCFLTETPRLNLRSPQVLLATGGVSYPKTGSVGDGQKFAKALGHKVLPYRPGLAGFELAEKWLSKHPEAIFPQVALRVLRADGREAGATAGEIVTTVWGARGGAMSDASRVVARLDLRRYEFEVDLCPALDKGRLAAELGARLAGANSLAGALAGWLVPRELAADFVREALGMRAGDLPAAAARQRAAELAGRLKTWRLHPERPRGLKEAMVTVGGVALDEIEPQTMRSRRCPGLLFAGEVMDVDGPTGGFNLQAAFSTARLAVRACAAAPGRASDA